MGILGEIPTSNPLNGTHTSSSPLPPRRKLLSSGRVMADRMKHRLIKWILINTPYYKFKVAIQWAATLFILGTIVFFAVLAANTVVFGGPMNFGPEDSLQANAAVTNFIQTCKNTVQGKQYVTDDKGYVCKKMDLDAISGCCKRAERKSFSCPREYCNTTSSCCNSYEYCVACCMGPSKDKIRSDLIATTTDPILLQSKDNVFELCRSACRTSSKSLYSQNKYRHETKHCFGPTAPPLHNETAPEQGLPSGDEDEGPFNVMLDDSEAINPTLYKNYYRVAGKTSNAMQHLNAANAFRIILLAVLLFQLLLPLDQRKPKVHIF